MHGSGQQSNGYVASLQAPWSIGFGPPGDDRLTTVLPWVEREPEPLRWLRLVAAAGAASESTRLELPIADQERHTASTLLGPIDGRPLIGLHVGSSLPNRRWPPASYAALADRLGRELDARMILTGSSAERELTAAVREAMHGPALDLAGETTIGEYAAVIAALDLLVTNDTSASHIAAATCTRSVILFGPTRPERWAPLDLSLHHIIDASAYAGPGVDGASALQALPPDLVARRCFGALREERVVRGESRLERLA
jgi:ADP-heptose:LPS heptosyltransferase